MCIYMFLVCVCVFTHSTFSIYLWIVLMRNVGPFSASNLSHWWFLSPFSFGHKFSLDVGVINYCLLPSHILLFSKIVDTIFFKHFNRKNNKDQDEEANYKEANVHSMPKHEISFVFFFLQFLHDSLTYKKDEENCTWICWYAERVKNGPLNKH